MLTLLNIQSSPRIDNSLSRVLSDKFIEQWKIDNPDGRVITRDLMKTDLPYINQAWLGGAFFPTEKQTPEMLAEMKVSDELVAELKAADQIVMGVPMHNFTVPANLKAYLDQVVRFKHTYNLNGGILNDKPTTIVLASGRLYTPGAPEAQCDYASGFLKCVLAYMGIRNIRIVLAGGMRAVNFGQETFESYVEKYLPEIMFAANEHRVL